MNRAGDTLERKLSGCEEHRRREVGGSEGDLTELAILDPIDRNCTRADSYELVERKARRNKSKRAADAFLTEAAAPAPVYDENLTISGEVSNDAAPQSPSLHSTEEKPEEEVLGLSATATNLYTISLSSLILHPRHAGPLECRSNKTATLKLHSPLLSSGPNIGGSLFLGSLAEHQRVFQQKLSKSDSDAEVARKAYATPRQSQEDNTINHQPYDRLL